MWAERLGLDTVPGSTALFTITALTDCNIASVVLLVRRLTGKDLLGFFHLPVGLLLPTLAIYIGGYFLFAREPRFEKLRSRFLDETNAQRRRGNLIATLVAGGSLLIFFTLVGTR